MTTPAAHAGRTLGLTGRRARPVRTLGAGLVGAALALTVLNVTLGLGGDAVSDNALPAFGELVLAVSVGAIALRAIRLREDRAAWGALAAGALFWMAGDVYRMSRSRPASTAISPPWRTPATCRSIRASTSACGSSSGGEPRAFSPACGSMA